MKFIEKLSNLVGKYMAVIVVLVAATAVIYRACLRCGVVGKGGGMARKAKGRPRPRAAAAVCAGNAALS